MLRRRSRAGRGSPPCPAHYSGARLARIHPRAGPPRESPIVPGEAVLRAGVCPALLAGGTGGRWPPGSRTPAPPQAAPLVQPDRPWPGLGPPTRQRVRDPPLRFAFFSRLSYWCDIRCACT
jgi:hypothetical protein